MVAPYQPQDRYATAGDMLRALESVEQGKYTQTHEKTSDIDSFIDVDPWLHGGAGGDSTGGVFWQDDETVSPPSGNKQEKRKTNVDEGTEGDWRKKKISDHRDSNNVFTLVRVEPHKRDDKSWVGSISNPIPLELTTEQARKGLIVEVNLFRDDGLKVRVQVPTGVNTGDILGMLLNEIKDSPLDRVYYFGISIKNNYNPSSVYTLVRFSVPSANLSSNCPKIKLTPEEARKGMIKHVSIPPMPGGIDSIKVNVPAGVTNGDFYFIPPEEKKALPFNGKHLPDFFIVEVNKDTNSSEKTGCGCLILIIIIIVFVWIISNADVQNRKSQISNKYQIPEYFLFDKGE